MINKIQPLAQLLQVLQQVPYLASKNLYKVASHFLSLEEKDLEFFCAILLKAKQQIGPCATCFVWRQREKSCVFCEQKDRNQRIICVVESWQELLAIEKTEAYKGVYHVLGGLICPLEGVGPEEITIKELTQRIQSHNIEEIIFAFNQTPEGEATATYIAQLIRDMPTRISCLARGMPVGSSLVTMDRLTVYKALCDRKPF